MTGFLKTLFVFFILYGLYSFWQFQSNKEYNTPDPEIIEPAKAVNDNNDYQSKLISNKNRNVLKDLVVKYDYKINGIGNRIRINVYIKNKSKINFRFIEVLGQLKNNRYKKILEETEVVYNLKPNEKREFYIELPYDSDKIASCLVEIGNIDY